MRDQRRVQRLADIWARRSGRSSGKGRSLRFRSVVLRVAVIVGIVGVSSVALETAAWAVTDVSIGNGPAMQDGSYINAGNLSLNLRLNAVVVTASDSITIVDPVDLSTSILGPPANNLSLVAPTINIDHNLKMAANGHLYLNDHVELE